MLERETEREGEREYVCNTKYSFVTVVTSDVHAFGSFTFIQFLHSVSHLNHHPPSIHFGTNK